MARPDALPTRLAALAALAAALLLAVLPAGAGGPDDPAVRALRTDSSLKVRAQAALVLGQRGGPEAVAALRSAVAVDDAAAVRLAAISALSRLGARAARGTLRAAGQADPDGAVRAAATRALTALGPVSLAVEDPPASSAARAGLAASLARHLADVGLLLAEPAELRLTPAAAVEVSRADGKVVVAVKASLSGLDADGRVLLLERAVRASVAGAATEARLTAATARAVDAALEGLCEDLAVRLGGR